MSSLWQKTMIYLGLVDEEHLEAEPDTRVAQNGPSQAQVRTVRSAPAEARVVGRRVEPPPSASRSVAAERREERAPRMGSDSGAATGSVRPVPSGEAQCEVVEVTQFEQAKLIADRIRERTPVVMNLRNADPDMVRRLVDFASGLTYALDGSMRKTEEGVILVLPPRVTVGREEQRRLASLGLYRLDGESI